MCLTASRLSARVRTSQTALFTCLSLGVTHALEQSALGRVPVHSDCLAPRTRACVRGMQSSQSDRCPAALGQPSTESRNSPLRRCTKHSQVCKSGLWGLHSIFLEKQLTKCYSKNAEKTGCFPILVVTVVREPRVGTAAMTCRQARPGSTQARARQALLGSQPLALYFQHTQPPQSAGSEGPGR